MTTVSTVFMASDENTRPLIMAVNDRQAIGSASGDDGDGDDDDLYIVFGYGSLIFRVWHPKSTATGLRQQLTFIFFFPLWTHYWTRACVL